MQNQSHRKRHGQYYTGSSFGALLVDSLRDDAVNVAVELGVGNGALLNAVRGRWPRARYISVDIDPVHQRSHVISEDQHYCLDALEIELPTAIGLQHSFADLAVCNPPFVSPKWRPSFEVILKRVGLPFPGASVRIGADVLFLAQNLWMLKKNGQLGIIVPSGLISGVKGRIVREALMKQHTIREVIELPSSAFVGTEVKTFIIIIIKEHTNDEPIKLTKFSTIEKVEPSIYISKDEASVRLDYGYYAWQKKSAESDETKNLFVDKTIKIIRGNVSTSTALKNGWEILHTTNIQNKPSNAAYLIPKKYAPNSALESKIVARADDIVIARVGRNLENKIIHIKEGTAVISDCLYIIRSEKISASKIYQALTSTDGMAWIRAHTKGACAQYINKCDLLKFPFQQ